MKKSPLLKKEFIIIIITFFVITSLMIVATTAWLPRRVWKTENIKYDSDLIVSSLDIDVVFQAYNDDLEDYIDIAMYKEGEISPGTETNVTVTLSPGDRQSYRFKIKNNSSYTRVSTDIILEKFTAGIDDLQFNSDPNRIFEYLSVYVSTPEIYEIPKLSDALIESYTGDLNIDFYNDLVIEPNEEINLVWYIELSTDAGNEFWGTYFGFSSIFFSV